MHGFPATSRNTWEAEKAVCLVPHCGQWYGNHSSKWWVEWRVTGRGRAGRRGIHKHTPVQTQESIHTFTHRLLHFHPTPFMHSFHKLAEQQKKSIPSYHEDRATCATIRVTRPQGDRWSLRELLCFSGSPGRQTNLRANSTGKVVWFLDVMWLWVLVPISLYS